jgi:hypothetical protein
VGASASALCAALPGLPLCGSPLLAQVPSAAGRVRTPITSSSGPPSPNNPMVVVCRRVCPATSVAVVGRAALRPTARAFMDAANAVPAADFPVRVHTPHWMISRAECSRLVGNTVRLAANCHLSVHVVALGSRLSHRQGSPTLLTPWGLGGEKTGLLPSRVMGPTKRSRLLCRQPVTITVCRGGRFEPEHRARLSIRPHSYLGSSGKVAVSIAGGGVRRADSAVADIAHWPPCTHGTRGRPSYPTRIAFEGKAWIGCGVAACGVRVVDRRRSGPTPPVGPALPVPPPDRACRNPRG